MENRVGADIGSFLEQVTINCRIVKSRQANFRGNRGVSCEIMHMNSIPKVNKQKSFQRVGGPELFGNGGVRLVACGF